MNKRSVSFVAVKNDNSFSYGALIDAIGTRLGCSYVYLSVVSGQNRSSCKNIPMDELLFADVR